MMKIIFIVVIIVNVCSLVYGQEKKIQVNPVGIVNGRPINLIKPPLANCDCKLDSPIQTVKVEIDIDESGKVVKATAISGHIFYQQLAEKAALASKFSASYHSGTRQPAYSELIYKFNYFENTVTVENSIVRFTKESNEPISLPIINGKATYLPKPIYPDKAKNTCAKGEVRIEILIDENGNVIESKPISGDELLWDSAVEAVNKAKVYRNFDAEPTKIKGVIVYNFLSEENCLYTDRIVNEKAISLPKPVYPKSCRCVGKIRVRIVIDMDGNVIFAEPFSGHPLLRISAVEAARKAKFSPTLINGESFLIVAYLEYKFNSDGTIEY